MQLQSTILAIALAATSVFAQTPSLTGLPQCAQGAALGSISNSGCQLTDVGCICRNQSFLSGLQSQVQQACPSPQDQAAAAAFAAQLCAQYGVTLPTGGSSAPASTSAVSTSASSVPVSSATYTSTLTYVATGTSGLPSASSNGTGVVSPSPTSPIVTGAAAAANVQAGVALLVGVVGAVVAL